jgi:hypothetical protein
MAVVLSGHKIAPSIGPRRVSGRVTGRNACHANAPAAMNTTKATMPAIDRFELR